MKYFFILLSIVVGIVLTLMPLPQWAIFLRPQWMLMVVLFWILMLPFQVGVVFAWMVGLLADLMIGTPLCQHAIAFLIVAYFFLKAHRIVFHAPVFQQALYVGFFALLSVMIQAIVLHMSGHSGYVGLNMLSVFFTMAFWPMVCGCLSGVGIGNE